MRKVYIETSEAFYCPLTGVRVWSNDPEEYRGSPATRFIYIEEPTPGFTYLDEPFAEAITKVSGPFLMDGKPDAYFGRLCRGMKGERYIDFVIYCRWGIIHVGIDTFDERSRQPEATLATVPVDNGGTTVH